MSSLLGQAECLKKVSPRIGGIFFATSGNAGDAEQTILSALGGDALHYKVNSWATSLGRHGSPLHGKMEVTFVWRLDLPSPCDVFGKIYTKKCTSTDALMTAVSPDLRRGWLEMQLQAEGDAGELVPAAVRQCLDNMKEAGLLPERFAPAGLGGIRCAATALAVARMEALQWWIVEEGKAFGIIDVSGKNGIAHIDGSCPKLSGKKTMVVAWRTGEQPPRSTFRAVTHIDVLAILGYDPTAYNISVSTQQNIAQMLAHCVPVTTAFAAVISAASVSAGQ